MEEDQAQALFIYMQKVLPDVDGLLEDYRARAYFIRFLEENEYDAVTTACKKFKEEQRFPAISDLVAEMGIEPFLESRVASKDLAGKLLAEAREKLKK